MYIGNNQLYMFPTLTLRPHWMQYFINEFQFMLLALVSFGIYAFAEFKYHELFIWPTLGLLVYLLSRGIYMLRMEYVVSGEQLIIMHGVLNHATDYVELYRIIDYQDHRSFWQQVFGLKSVTIYSGDKTNPVVVLFGVKETVDVVSEIRQRVEFNKRRRGIYEFTNQS